MAKSSNMAPRRVQVPARVEVDLIDAVRAEALKNRRTLGQELAVIIEEALRARGVSIGKPKK